MPFYIEKPRKYDHSFVNVDRIYKTHYHSIKYWTGQTISGSVRHHPVWRTCYVNVLSQTANVWTCWQRSVWAMAVCTIVQSEFLQSEPVCTISLSTNPKAIGWTGWPLSNISFEKMICCRVVDMQTISGNTVWEANVLLLPIFWIEPPHRIHSRTNASHPINFNRIGSRTKVWLLFVALRSVGVLLLSFTWCGIVRMISV